nr:hypothetical protein [Candidatus Sigynarchaeota archaeon]
MEGLMGNLSKQSGWLKEIIDLQASRDRLLSMLESGGIKSIESLVKHVEIISKILAEMVEIDTKIMDNTKQVEQSGRGDGLNAMIGAKSMNRSLFSSFELGFLKGLASYLTGKTSAQDFAAEGIVKISVVAAVINEPEQSTKYLTFFDVIQRPGNKPLPWLTAQLAHVLEKEEKCNHIHSMKLVATRPDGSKETLYQGRVAFPQVVPKGPSKCSKCGKQSVELDMCMDCGAKVCPKCGMASDRLDRCTSCGLSFI